MPIPDAFLDKGGEPVFKRRKTDDSNGETLSATFSASTDSDKPDVPNASRAFTDPGLGVPPFRPAAPPKEPAMSRSPLAPPPPAPTQSGASRPATIPPRPSQDPAERRTLVVGRGISVQGTVQDAERLVVEGTVEATMIHATELSVCPGGMFKGEIEVEDAEIAGTINGTLTVRGSLTVRESGRVLGTARYRRLQVENGGQISGQMEMLTDTTISTKPEHVRIPEPAI
jgi:cytoskeletal protein CcmA (bactofilin family)